MPRTSAIVTTLLHCRLMIAALSVACFSLTSHASEIVIGQVAPLTGVLASTGKDMVLGAKVYFDHINAKGGINGKKSGILPSMMVTRLMKHFA